MIVVAVLLIALSTGAVLRLELSSSNLAIQFV